MRQHNRRRDAPWPSSLPVAALFAALAAELVAAPALTAQVTQQVWCAELPNTVFATSVDGLGDVDGDGVPDVVIGAASTVASPWLGETRVVSGATGATLWSFGSLGEVVACAGDVDGDGTPDVATASGTLWPFWPPETVDGYAAVRSGANGGLLLSWPEPPDVRSFGSSIDGAGDVNADGSPDIIVGAPVADSPGHTNNGRVQVLSGADGGVLLDLHGAKSGGNAGASVAGVGDLDGDGRADVAFNDHAMIGVSVNVVRVVSGATGATLHLLIGPGSSAVVDAAGDVDGDSVPDVLAAFPATAGSVRVYSGLDGAVLLQVPGPVVRARALGDVSGDGVPDVAMQPTAGQVRVLSGADGALLYALSGPPSFGDALAGVGDVTGNGKSALAVGTPQEAAGPEGTGRARLIAFDPPSIASIEPAVVQAVEAGSTVVTLTGTGFDWVTQLHVGAVDLSIDDPAITLVGPTQISFTLPAPDALGPHAVTVSNATVASAAVTLTYVETHPPTLSAPEVTGTGQPFAWSWYGGTGDTAVLLGSFSSSTAPVQGWTLLYPFTIVYLAPLDEIGAGGLAVTMPSLPAGLFFWSQVATVDGGLAGTSNVTATFVAF